MHDTKARAEREEEATEGFGPDFKPLSAEEAQRWRARQAPLSVWRVVGGQALAGVLVTLVAWLWSGSIALASSAAWVAFSVVMPAALFARGLGRSASARSSGAALLQMMVWETVKVVVTLAMLLASPRVISQLSWPVLVASFVVTMKVYWLVWWLHARRQTGRV